MKELKNCKVALVGAGYMAREHIRAFQDIPGVSIEGITSQTRERAEKLAEEFKITRVCDSIPELREKTGADLVLVTVPELAANSVSRACFEYPWTVLLEKPVGYNFEDAEEIAAVAREKGRKAYVALNRRYYSSTRSALADMKTVEGRRFIHVQDQEDPKRALQAGQPAKVCENWMYANSIHVIDYFLLFGRGKIVNVENIVPWTPADPWMVVAKVMFDSGDIGLYEGVWNGPGPWFVSIGTPAKRWELRPLEQAAYQIAGQRKLETVEVHAWDQQFKPGLRLQAEKAVAAALGTVIELPTLDDALESMRLVKAIFGM